MRFYISTVSLKKSELLFFNVLGYYTPARVFWE
jgi:hypothetical protein